METNDSFARSKIIIIELLEIFSAITRRKSHQQKQKQKNYCSVSADFSFWNFNGYFVCVITQTLDNGSV